jgi:hypothetical protein
MRIAKTTIILGLLILGAGAAYYIVTHAEERNFFTGNLADLFKEKSEEPEITDPQPIESDPFANSEFEHLVAGDTPDTKRYVNTAYYFLFEYPADMTITSFGEDEISNIILIQDTQTETVNRSFQIFMYPFDEPLPVLTPQRLWQDLPDLIIDQPQEIVLGDGTHALMFLSEVSEIGRTREIYITHNEMIYQITSRVDADPWIANIMNSWEFF